MSLSRRPFVAPEVVNVLFFGSKRRHAGFPASRRLLASLLAATLVMQGVPVRTMASSDVSAEGDAVQAMAPEAVASDGGAGSPADVGGDSAATEEIAARTAKPMKPALIFSPYLTAGAPPK